MTAVARLIDGSRKILSISEVIGVDDDQVVMEHVYVFDRSGVGKTGKALGTFRATGHIPQILGRLKAYGVQLPRSIFSEVHEVKER